MKPDHELAKMHAENFKDGCGRYMPSDGGNIYRAYLDAMTCLDKATELLRELIDGLVPCNEPVEPGSVVARVDAFLDERK